MATVDPRPIADGEELTQYGTTTEPFRNEPRWWKESAVSLVLGGWDPLAAGEIVRGWALDDGTDAARYTTAGTLRSKGFTVTHRPTKRNSEHVTVTVDGAWDVSVCQAFDGCFGVIEVGEGGRYVEDDDPDASM